MPRHQFTISPQGVTTITPDGVVVVDHAAQPSADPKYADKPVHIAVHHDLTLQLHGSHFNASVRLSADEALGLLNILAYVVREHLATKRG